MLDVGRYLLGVFEIALLAGFATLGASALRTRLLPTFSGAPAHLATAVLALALVIWIAEILGSFALFEPVPYLAAVALAGLGLRLGLGGGWGGPSSAAASCFSPQPRSSTAANSTGEKPSKQEGPPRPPPPSLTPEPAAEGTRVATLVALVIAALAIVKFGVDVRSKLGAGVTGFDSTWYHAPFAAGFFQSGNTWDLHFIAPQFLAWFYPANAEIFHSIGMLAVDRDVLSPLLNLGWFVGCLVACWCIGRPYRVAPWSLALGAVALSLPVLSDQAGEARNDIVGIFFLLAAVAIALNTRYVGGGGRLSRGEDPPPLPDPEPAAAGRRVDPLTGTHGEMGPVIIAGLVAGLAAGTKLNLLLPAAVFVSGLTLVAPAGGRRRALVAAGLAALAGGGYWYLRNLAHSGNPLPWFDDLGPISLPAPEQALGGREGHSVLGYLADGAVWSDWFLPGLHGGLTALWPLLIGLALGGLLLSFVPLRRLPVRDGTRPNEEQRPPGESVSKKSGFGRSGVGHDRVLAVVSAAGLAVIVAWLIAPTSASGPEGMPRGFESGLRYLAPALVLGLAVLPAALLPRVAWGGAPGKARRPVFRPTHSASKRLLPWRKTQHRPGAPPQDRTRGPIALGALAVLLAVIAIGYPVQRHYLENRYANPTFAAPGLNAAFKWATQISDARIATTSTRQYPLYGTDLSNHVQYIGEEQPSGGFTAPTSCRQWRRLLNTGHYDYVVTSRDRIEPGKPPYPASARWTEGPGSEILLREPPTVVFRLSGPLAPARCPY
jgi:hypothetical protein